MLEVIALEEHWTTPEIRRAWAALPRDLQDDSLGILNQFGIGERLEETDEQRLRAMDDMGIDVQVLSLTVPGVHNFEPAQAVALAGHANDAMADVIARHPHRFQGFAALPTAQPEQAAAELERAVEGLGFKGALIHGRTRDRNLDAAEFEPIYTTASKLRVPIYIHPQLPVKAVRDAYYAGFSKPLEVAFAGGGLGWHYETGIQFIRLVLNGTLDRYPDLQFILGHWGEVVLFYIDRIQLLDVATKLDRPIRDYFVQNAYYTPSGMLSRRDLRRTVEAVGANRIMFSTDYPYAYAMELGIDPEISKRWVNMEVSAGGGARRFIEQAGLSRAEQEMFANGNWKTILSARDKSVPVANDPASVRT